MLVRIQPGRAVVVLAVCLAVGLLTPCWGAGVNAQTGGDHPPVTIPLPLWEAASPFNTPIPADARYLPEDRIGTFRRGYDEWSMPIYRLATSAGVPLVTVTNHYSGRVEYWPIPTTAIPAPEADAHMAVIIPAEGVLYELWDTEWTGPAMIRAGGMVSFPLDGPGISDPPHYRVTAAGFAVTAGMIIREDFLNPASGALDPDQPIAHALTMSLPFELVMENGYVAPAVGGEAQGEAGLEGVPLGARFALARDLDVDGLDVHPLTREILRAARDFGMYVNDTNGAVPFDGQYVGVIGMEPGLTETLYQINGEELLDRMAAEIYSVVQDHGLFRVILPGEDPSVVRRDGAATEDESANRDNGRRGGRRSQDD